ncbi:T9SS type A sorting domain-containing protein [bacterium]|nr:T9SS type A sorting domain-containing protein [bacterium]
MFSRIRMFQASLFFLLISFIIPTTLFAVGLQATLTLEQPESGYYLPGETFTATLSLADNDGTPLFADEAGDNGIRTIQLWISGPKQDYNGLEGYSNLTIVAYQGVYQPDAGFDPETGEIEITLPDELDGSGSYTVMFKCQRVTQNTWYSQYPLQDFQVSTTIPTRTGFVRYVDCTNCHDEGPPLAHHGTDEVDRCVVCHSHNHPQALFEMYHGHHTNNCVRCHGAGGGINHYSRNACFTCHNAPNGHRDYTDNMCENCHHDNLSVYARHDVDEPTLPENFDLLSPEDGAFIEGIETLLSWNPSDDDDAGDQVDYLILLAEDEEFTENVRFWFTANTEQSVDGLQPGQDYFWKIRAEDYNTQGTWSNQTFHFSTEAGDQQLLNFQNHYFELISLNQTPQNLAPEAVFEGIESLSIIYQNDGSIYIPGFINSIGELSVENAYRVFCNEDETLLISGDWVPLDNEYLLETGRWNWLAFPYPYEVPAEMAFEQIMDHILIVQSDDGRVMIPDLGINTLENLIPGEGFLMVLDEDITFQYPEFDQIAGMPVRTQSEFNSPVQPTGLPYTVVVDLSQDILDQQPAAIEIFDGSLLVGYAEIQPGEPRHTVISWRGDQKQKLYGYTPGNSIDIKILKHDGSQIPVRGGDIHHFEEDWYSVLALETDLLPEEFILATVYPNPFNPSTQVAYYLSHHGEVEFEVFDIMGRKLYENRLNSDSGWNNWIFDTILLENQPVSGLYFLKLTYDGQSITEKLMLMK